MGLSENGSFRTALLILVFDSAVENRQFPKTAEGSYTVGAFFRKRFTLFRSYLSYFFCEVFFVFINTGSAFYGQNRYYQFFIFQITDDSVFSKFVIFKSPKAFQISDQFGSADIIKTFFIFCLRDFFFKEYFYGASLRFFEL